MRPRNRQRGATLLEFAITFMVFFMIAMGIYEFGRVFNMYQVLTDVVREGARYSVAPLQGTSMLPSPADVEARVQTFLTSDNLSNGTATVQQTMPVMVNGISIVYTQVQVTAPYQFIFFPFATLNLSATSSMRNETN